LTSVESRYGELAGLISSSSECGNVYGTSLKVKTDRGIEDDKSVNDREISIDTLQVKWGHLRVLRVMKLPDDWVAEDAKIHGEHAPPSELEQLEVCVLLNREKTDDEEERGSSEEEKPLKLIEIIYLNTQRRTILTWGKEKDSHYLDIADIICAALKAFYDAFDKWGNTKTCRSWKEIVLPDIHTLDKLCNGNDAFTWKLEREDGWASQNDSESLYLTVGGSGYVQELTRRRAVFEGDFETRFESDSASSSSDSDSSSSDEKGECENHSSSFSKSSSDGSSSDDEGDFEKRFGRDSSSASSDGSSSDEEDEGEEEKLDEAGKWVRLQAATDRRCQRKRERAKYTTSYIQYTTSSDDGYEGTIIWFDAKVWMHGYVGPNEKPIPTLLHSSLVERGAVERWIGERSDAKPITITSSIWSHSRPTVSKREIWRATGESLYRGTYYHDGPISHILNDLEPNIENSPDADRHPWAKHMVGLPLGVLPPVYLLCQVDDNSSWNCETARELAFYSTDMFSDSKDACTYTLMPYDVLGRTQTVHVVVPLWEPHGLVKPSVMVTVDSRYTDYNGGPLQEEKIPTTKDLDTRLRENSIAVENSYLFEMTFPKKQQHGELMQHVQHAAHAQHHLELHVKTLGRPREHHKMSLEANVDGNARCSISWDEDERCLKFSFGDASRGEMVSGDFKYAPSHPPTGYTFRAKTPLGSGLSEESTLQIGDGYNLLPQLPGESQERYLKRAAKRFGTMARHCLIWTCNLAAKFTFNANAETVFRKSSLRLLLDLFGNDGFWSCRAKAPKLHPIMLQDDDDDVPQVPRYIYSALNNWYLYDDVQGSNRVYQTVKEQFLRNRVGAYVEQEIAEIVAHFGSPSYETTEIDYRHYTIRDSIETAKVSSHLGSGQPAHPLEFRISKRVDGDLLKIMATLQKSGGGEIPHEESQVVVTHVCIVTGRILLKALFGANGQLLVHRQENGLRTGSIYKAAASLVGDQICPCIIKLVPTGPVFYEKSGQDTEESVRAGAARVAWIRQVKLSDNGASWQYCSSMSGDECKICYIRIATHVAITVDGVCDHSFCEECWKRCPKCPQCSSEPISLRKTADMQQDELKTAWSIYYGGGGFRYRQGETVVAEGEFDKKSFAGIHGYLNIHDPAILTYLCMLRDPERVQKLRGVMVV
jgi:hypothetical protein